MKLCQPTFVATFAGIATTFSPALARIMSGSALPGFADAVNFQLESRQAWRDRFFPQELLGSHNVRRQSAAQFSNPQAQEFYGGDAKRPLNVLSAQPEGATGSASRSEAEVPGAHLSADEMARLAELVAQRMQQPQDREEPPPTYRKTVGA